MQSDLFYADVTAGQVIDSEVFMVESRKKRRD